MFPSNSYFDHLSQPSDVSPKKKLTGAKGREWMGMGEWDDY